MTGTNCAACCLDCVPAITTTQDSWACPDKEVTQGVNTLVIRSDNAGLQDSLQTGACHPLHRPGGEKDPASGLVASSEVCWESSPLPQVLWEGTLPLQRQKILQGPTSQRPLVSWAEWHYPRTKAHKQDPLTAGSESQLSTQEAHDTVERDKLARSRPHGTVRTA